MEHTKDLFYKLQIFDKTPSSFEGVLYSFDKQEGTIHIDLESDPFLAIKKAAASAIGKRCGLVISGMCLFTELFISTYEKLGLLFLEIKDNYKHQIQSFLEKKDLNLEAIDFDGDKKNIPCIIVGKGSSLLKDIELIKKHENDALIISAYSALEDLDRFQIQADFAFAQDPQQKFHGFTNANTLLITAKTSTKIAQGFSKIALFPESFCQFSSYLFSKKPSPPSYGYTIVDLVIKFLMQQGFETFYLTGVDLEETGGRYADQTECGYKPDFKLARQHIDEMRNGCCLRPLKEFEKDAKYHKKVETIFHDIGSKELIYSFENSKNELKKVDFQSLGLYEMFNLEQSPFYQLVLEPLYLKWLIFKQDKLRDKREFFSEILNSV